MADRAVEAAVASWLAVEPAIMIAAAINVRNSMCLLHLSLANFSRAGNARRCLGRRERGLDCL